MIASACLHRKFAKYPSRSFEEDVFAYKYLDLNSLTKCLMLGTVNYYLWTYLIDLAPLCINLILPEGVLYACIVIYMHLWISIPLVMNLNPCNIDHV
jgi:hypothetical protein